MEPHSATLEGNAYQAPKQNEHFVKREGILRELKCRFEGQSKRVVAGLCGICGVGKTQLAISWFFSAPYDYEMKVWFDASSKRKLQLQYVDFYTRHRESLYGGIKKGQQIYDNMKPLEEGISLEEQVKIVLIWLSKVRSRSLFVYDDCSREENKLEDDIVTIDVLKNEFLPNEESSHHIVVTTRSTLDSSALWNPAEKLVVDSMNPNESISLLEKITRTKDDKALELANALGNLPLVIAQASFYMSQTGRSASHYLELLQQNARQMLQTNTLGAAKDSIWTSLEKCFENLDDNPHILNIVGHLAWLGDSWIPQNFIEVIIADYKSEVEKSLAE